MEPTSAVVRVGEDEIHYLVVRPPGPPRGVLVALHGGGVDARYYHLPGTGPTMFAVAPAAGWVFVAPHRPGYPPTKAAGPDRLGLLDQAVTMASLTALMRDQFAPGAPVVLQGHSFGAMLAIAIAATTPLDGLVGLDVNGAGVAYRPEVIAAMRASGRAKRRGTSLPGPPSRPGQRLRTRAIGDAPVATANSILAAHHPVAAAELVDSREWETWFPRLATDVDVPVRYTMVAGDQFWVVDHARVAQAAALFRRAPWVDTSALAAGGHALEGFPAAESFRSSVIAFAERAVTDRRRRSAAD